MYPKPNKDVQLSSRSLIQEIRSKERLKIVNVMIVNEWYVQEISIELFSCESIKIHQIATYSHS